MFSSVHSDSSQVKAKDMKWFSDSGLLVSLNLVPINVCIVCGWDKSEEKDEKSVTSERNYVAHYSKPRSCCVSSAGADGGGHKTDFANGRLLSLLLSLMDLYQSGWQYIMWRYRGVENKCQTLANIILAIEYQLRRLMKVIGRRRGFLSHDTTRWIVVVA